MSRLTTIGQQSGDGQSKGHCTHAPIHCGCSSSRTKCRVTVKHFVAGATPDATARIYTVVSRGFLFVGTDDCRREDTASGAPLGCGEMGREGQSFGALADIEGVSTRFAAQTILDAHILDVRLPAATAPPAPSGKTN